MKLFYTGPVINAEMLVVMLEKHGISARQEFVEETNPLFRRSPSANLQTTQRLLLD
jgi:hypothetical protein